MPSNAEAGPVGTKARHRSPNYPAISLPEAIERTGKLYAADKKAGAPLEAALRHMGFSGKHGKSMMVVSALKKYGLVEEVAGRVAPTQRAVEILVLAKDDRRRLEAIREAALSPDIYRELFDQFQENGLPSDETLASELIAYKGFNPSIVASFVRDYRTTMDYASLTDVIEVQSSDEQGSPVPVHALKLNDPGGPKPVHSTTPTSSGDVEHPISVSKRFIWPLSKNITATVEFSGDEVCGSHIELLQKYLELVKAAVQTNIAIDEGKKEV